MNPVKTTFLALLLFFCIKSAQSTNVLESNPTSTANLKPHVELNQVWLNIFVHGIRNIKYHTTPPNLINFFTDSIANTLYETSIKCERGDAFFFQTQAMQHVGLHPIDVTSTKPGDASTAVALIFNRSLDLTNTPASTNYYYTAGWHGLMSASSRYQEAKFLITEIEKELVTFRTNGIEPKIRLLGYSHGGNVILEMARAVCTKEAQPTFVIDEFISIATPIQGETDFLINEPLFQKIYHFYSPSDRVQPLDPFTRTQLFSRRTFTPRKGFNLTNKLVQIEVQLHRNAHCKNERPEYTALRADFTNSKILSGQSRLLRNMSPGHIEMWFFGWTAQHYRQDFSLYPLSITHLAPYLIEQADTFHDHCAPEAPIVLDLRPDQDVIVIKNKRTGTKVPVPFLPKVTLEELKTIALQYKPDNFTLEEYNRRSYLAKCEARKHHQRKKALRKKSRSRFLLGA